MNEPTRGVDVGAKQEITDLIQKLAGEGFAFVVSSSELEELILLADRILVLNRGRVAAGARRGRGHQGAADPGGDLAGSASHGP